MNRYLILTLLACVVASAALGISVLNRVNHNQVHVRNGETCFTVKHSTTFYNSGRNAAGKVVFFADKLHKGDKICHR